MSNDIFTIAMARSALGLLVAFAAGPVAPAADFPQGLALQFSFDQSESGGLITDRTGRGNNGRNVGAKWTSAGRQGGAFEFAATNGYIQATNSASLNSTQATFAAWFKAFGSNAPARCLLDKLPASGYALSIVGATNDNDGKDRGKLRALVNGQACLSDNVVADGAWHHGAATFDGEKLKLYVDGQLQKQEVAWRGEIASNTNDLTIGMNRSSPEPPEEGQSFDGMIDEVTIFNHALSDAEVKTVFTALKPMFTQDQVARRLIELKELYDRGLLRKDFYDRKVKECEVAP